MHPSSIFQQFCGCQYESGYDLSLTNSCKRPPCHSSNISVRSTNHRHSSSFVFYSDPIYPSRGHICPHHLLSGQLDPTSDPSTINSSWKPLIRPFSLRFMTWVNHHVFNICHSSSWPDALTSKILSLNGDPSHIQNKLIFDTCILSVPDSTCLPNTDR